MLIARACATAPRGMMTPRFARSARTGQPVLSVRLSPPAHSTAPEGRDDQPHEDSAHLQGGSIPNIVDDVTRKCLQAVADTSISGRSVVREMADRIAERGKPGMIVSVVTPSFPPAGIRAWRLFCA